MIHYYIDIFKWGLRKIELNLGDSCSRMSGPQEKLLMPPPDRVIKKYNVTS